MFTVRIWRETFDPPGLVKTDWAWFDDAHEESHDEYHVADRHEVLGHFTAWLDRFLTRPDRPDARAGTHEHEKPPAEVHDPPTKTSPPS